MTLRRSRFWSLVLAYAFFLAALGIHPIPRADATVYQVAVTPKFKAFEPGTGNPLASGKLYTYLPGTTTLTTTYKDYAGGSLNTNPIILDANGECDLYFTGYLKLALYDVNNVLVWTKDNIPYGPFPRYYSSAAYDDNLTLYGNDLIARGPWVDVRAFGAESVTLAGVQSAVDCTVTKGRPILIPSGVYNFAGTVTLPNWPVRIYGDNAVINQTGSAPTFLQENHAYTEIHGIEFTGNGIPIKFNATPTGTMSLDGLIEGNRFLQDAGVYGIWLYGTRTVYVQNNLFSGGGNGIYMQSTCLPFVINGTFKGASAAGIGTGNGIIYDGDGLGTSCGLGLRDSEILGYDNGLIIRDTPGGWANLNGNTIDYNNNSIRLESAVHVDIVGGNYIGGSQIYDNAAIWIGQSTQGVSTPDYSTHIAIIGNELTGHRESGTAYDSIRITNATVNVRIIGNTIGFWNRYAINADNTTNLTIAENYTSPRATFGTAAIHNSGSGGDSTWLILSNQFGTYGADASSTTFATYSNNIGHETRDCGTTAYDNVTSATISFSGTLAATPNVVMVTPTKALDNVYVDTVTTTNFKVYSSNAVVGAAIMWCAEKRTD